MPELIIQGPAGRIEARYNAGPTENAPIALVLHSHPRAAGNLQDRVTVVLARTFQCFGFAVMRFNFRGVGRSMGTFDNGKGELEDAASALDYLQAQNPDARECWVAGHSFGAVTALQLLMRRPEIKGFISVAPPVEHYDLSFLAPCPASGVVLYGSRDSVARAIEVERAVQRIKTQKDIKVDYRLIDGADHLFDTNLEAVEREAIDYLELRLQRPAGPLGEEL
jgi:alpha/beta superfamily hydrolase